MISPVMMFCQNSDTPKMFRPLASTPTVTLLRALGAERCFVLGPTVGTGALPGHERIVMLAGRLIREAVLMQNALSGNDAFSSADKGAALLHMVLEVADICQRLVERGVPATTIEEFDFGYNPDTPVAAIRDLATLRFVDAGESVILHGPVGVGKTHIAQALGHPPSRRGHTCVFTKTSRLLADLAGGHADHTWATRLRRWTRPDILILDDFAMRAFTVAQADDLYELITERDRASIIITANRAAADWYPLFPNPVVAESILDRLVNSAHHIAMPGRSWRPNRRPHPSDTPADTP